MTFWDSSAILPLLVREANSEAARALLEDDPGVVVWWGTPVECVSALARKEREGVVDSAKMKSALDRLDHIFAHSICVEASNQVRREARKLLRRHPLRAADSLQLAAACVFASNDTEGLGFVSCDDRLCLAAAKEGFGVMTP